MNNAKRKFRVKSDVAIFEVLQEYGKLSDRELAKKINIASATAGIGYKRLLSRDFFKIRAIPKLEDFNEVPMAVVGFADLEAEAIQKLKEKYRNKENVLVFAAPRSSI